MAQHFLRRCSLPSSSFGSVVGNRIAALVFYRVAAGRKSGFRAAPLAAARVRREKPDLGCRRCMPCRADKSASTNEAKESLPAEVRHPVHSRVRVIFACNCATGINLIIGFNANIFNPERADAVHYGNLIFTAR